MVKAHISKMEPRKGDIELEHTAVIIIDMQRDFLLPGGFGEKLGNDVSKLGRAIAPCQQVLAAARARNMLVIHTREVSLPSCCMYCFVVTHELTFFLLFRATDPAWPMCMRGKRTRTEP